MLSPDPDFDDPDLAAELESWRRADGEFGGFATIVAQRARIVELESEIDRLAERAQWWELETRRLEAELLAERSAGESTVDSPATPPTPASRRLPRLR